MTYWTIMLITVLSGPMENSQMYVLYSSEQACLDAVPMLSETLDYDHGVTCQVGDTPSGSIRPKARPSEGM